MVWGITRHSIREISWVKWAHPIGECSARAADYGGCYRSCVMHGGMKHFVHFCTHTPIVRRAYTKTLISRRLAGSLSLIFCGLHGQRSFYPRDVAIGTFLGRQKVL